MPARLTTIDLLLMSDFGRLQPERARELARRGSEKREPTKRESDERSTRPVAEQPRTR